jgi:DNA-binding transcriptional ArsR family regulator
VSATFWSSASAGSVMTVMRLHSTDSGAIPGDERGGTAFAGDGRHWALRVIWELRDEPLSFRSLQERCEGMSSSVLNQRLQELRAAGIVELLPGGDRRPWSASLVAWQG